MVVRTLIGKDKCLLGANEETRSRKVGFGGDAKNAIEKSWDEDGDDGVTMIAGSGDFSVTRGRERSGEYPGYRSTEGKDD